MKRAIKIARELNIGVGTLKGYLKVLGKDLNNFNKKVEPETERLILKVHKGIIKPQEREYSNAFLVRKGNSAEKQSSRIVNVHELPHDFKLDHPFIIDQTELSIDSNSFKKRAERKIEQNGKSVVTIFSDFEAFTICMGLENRHAKFIARNYFENPEISKDIIEAHEIALTTLNKYGGDLLSYIITLPPLPFKIVNATQIFTELDKRRKTQDFPILRFLYKNNEGKNEKLQISFFSERIENGRKRNVNVITVKNKNTGKIVMKVSRNGIVVPEQNNKQIIPILQTFIHFSKDTKSAIINYGLETGECSICGRELTDSNSIRRGIGPICYSYIN